MTVARKKKYLTTLRSYEIGWLEELWESSIKGLGRKRLTQKKKEDDMFRAGSGIRTSGHDLPLGTLKRAVQRKILKKEDQERV